MQGSGLTPGAPVFLGFTLSGQGSFGSAFGIIRIAPPVVLIPLTADSAGDVTLPVGIPPGVAGLAVFSEGLDLVSGLRTSLFAGTVL